MVDNIEIIESPKCSEKTVEKIKILIFNTYRYYFAQNLKLGSLASIYYRQGYSYV